MKLEVRLEGLTLVLDCSVQDSVSTLTHRIFDVLEKRAQMLAQNHLVASWLDEQAVAQLLKDCDGLGALNEIQASQLDFPRETSEKQQWTLFWAGKPLVRESLFKTKVGQDERAKLIVTIGRIDSPQAPALPPPMQAAPRPSAKVQAESKRLRPSSMNEREVLTDAEAELLRKEFVRKPERVPHGMLQTLRSIVNQEDATDALQTLRSKDKGFSAFCDSLLVAIGRAKVDEGTGQVHFLG